ncbi:epithelial splicing regulatory protein 2-like [Haemaphysalis longicornis]
MQRHAAQLLSSRRDCLHLQGLPRDATLETILELLGPYSHAVVLHGVYVVFDASGQLLGEAFVRMHSEDAALMVVENWDPHVMGPRRIDVSLCSFNIYELPGNAAAVQGLASPAVAGVAPPPASPFVAALLAVPAWSFLPPPVEHWYPSPLQYPAPWFYLPAGATMVLLRGLPYRCTVEDIIAFFGDFPSVTFDSVYIQRFVDGRATGEASVVFPSREEAERAVSEKQGRNIRHRYIELFIP